LYVNGVLKATGTHAEGDSSNTNDLAIGQTSASYEYASLTDDVRVYNYALTRAQVKMLYNQGSAARWGPQ
jgi:hypothetical protein